MASRKPYRRTTRHRVNVVGGGGSTGGDGRRGSGGGPLVKLYPQTVKLCPVDASRWALFGHWKESQLDTHIAGLVRDLQGLHHHIPDSRKMGEAGLPDHLCVIPSVHFGTTYLEAKRFYRGRPTLPTVDTLVDGHVRKGQETWFSALHASGSPVYLVYPTDAPDILSVLCRTDGYTRTDLWKRMRIWLRDQVWHLPCSPTVKVSP
jgi:hypothetical protein